MLKFIFSLNLFVVLNCFGQNASLRLSTQVVEKDTTFNVCLFRDLDTIYEQKFNTHHYVELDSLPSGWYKVCVYNTVYSLAPIYSRSFQLFQNKETFINIDLSYDENSVNIDTTGKKVDYKAEAQINLSYFENNWINSTSSIKSVFSIGISGANWLPLSKHFGLITGFGVGFSQYNFSKDTTFINAPQFKLITEKYTYINANLEFKVRISSGNQKKMNNKSSKMILDMGAIYYAPILFNHVARYTDDKKIINKHLHQFTDLRAVVNFGFYPFVIYGEYRIFNFIIGKYPEIPKYNIGIKFLLPAN